VNLGEFDSAGVQHHLAGLHRQSAARLCINFVSGTTQRTCQIARQREPLDLVSSTP
jgi:hypothetical protein